MTTKKDVPDILRSFVYRTLLNATPRSSRVHVYLGAFRAMNFPHVNRDLPTTSNLRNPRRCPVSPVRISLYTADKKTFVSPSA